MNTEEWQKPLSSSNYSEITAEMLPPVASLNTEQLIGKKMKETEIRLSDHRYSNYSQWIIAFIVICHKSITASNSSKLQHSGIVSVEGKQIWSARNMHVHKSNNNNNNKTGKNKLKESIYGITSEMKWNHVEQWTNWKEK